MALQTLNFDQVLDAVEALPPEDQTALLQILNQQGHKDYAAGNIVRGSVVDVMAALND
jgi:hypothetical protein